MRPACYTLTLLALLWAPHARAQALIRVGETWHYFKSRGLRSVIRPGWQLPEFNDARWDTAPSGYVFDDAMFSPLLRAGRHPGYAYLRKTFVVADPTQVKSLVLRIEFERAFVAYLNGREVAREPKAGSVKQVLQGDVARGFPTSPEGQIDLTGSISLLKPGGNLLAIEGPFSNEGAAAVPITASLLANFMRGPFVQNATSNSIQVIWRTLTSGNSTVLYGTSSNLDQRRFDARPLTEHVLTLTNLLPGERYFYRVQTELDAGPVQSEGFAFRTLPASGPIKFIVLGDSGQGTSAQWKISQVIRKEQPDLVLHCGDLVYGGINDRSVDWKLFNYYQPHMASTPYYMVVGNHDLNCCVGDGAPDYDPINWFFNATNFQNSFYLPTNSVTRTKHYYSFDAGDAHFVGLYNPWFADYDFTRDAGQYSWLTNDLARSGKPWKFIFMHMPLATSGGHFNRDDNTNSINDSTELMNLLLPVAERYGVQLVMGGHDHNFERFAPTNGVHHLVTGGGGGAVYEMKQRHPASAQFWATNHCTRVTVSNEMAVIEALDVQGKVFDSFVISRALPKDEVRPATWHTPRLLTNAVATPNRNLAGQVFDFAGPGLPARAGEWSNLGWSYVNNDADYLYIGLREVMIYGDSTVYLFVESPRQKGVSSLAGLGNGVADPKGQGADGLDFLENLSFTNFLPSIGCILGDENADGIFPGFRRPQARVALGQGVFQLSANLEPIPHAAMQQFNRSPDLNPGADESNADLIEVAIPLSSLGGPQAGDVIRIAAVVAGGELNPERQTQRIDRGGLAAFVEAGERVIISGVPFRLADKAK